MNGIYLYLLLREIRDLLLGRFVEALRVRERVVQIVLDKRTLVVSLLAQAPAVFLNRGRPRDFEHLNVFGDAILGSRITAVDQDGFMPAVRIRLEKAAPGRPLKFEILISLFKDAPNLRVVLPDAVKTLYPRFIERPSKKPITELTVKDLTPCSGRTGPAIIPGQFEGVDRYLLSEINTETMDRLKAVLSGVPCPPRLVSVLPLKISLFASEYVGEYKTLNDLLTDWYERFQAARSEEAIRARKTVLIKKLRGRIERLKKDLMPEELIEEQRRNGELLLANIGRVKRGMTMVRLFNHYTQKDATVELDPARSPQENARRYFDKYKKLKRGMPYIIGQIKNIEKEIGRIESSQDIAPPLKVPGKAGTRPGKPAPFREFPLPSGSVVYAGKSARSNENLTFKFARPDDYFFHARSIEGAHVILRSRLPRGQKPSKTDLIQAACAAAFFSKARGQKKVPVSYTQKKYLKKNRKGRPGSVILMREEVIFVDPALPA